MDFTSTEELFQIQRVVRDFAEKEIRPHVMEWDESGTFPLGTVSKLGELGLMGVRVPFEYGGAGLGYREYATVIEELSRVDGSVGLSVAAHNSLCTEHIFAFGTKAQRRRFVVPLARGEKIGAWALTEADAGSDAAAMRTTATLDGDGWILNGQKTFTTHGSVGDIYVVMAVTDKTARHHGISAFVVEKGAPGFHTGKNENKLGLRASDTSSLTFDDCFVPKENVLGQVGEGFLNAMAILDGGRISIAALAVGMAQGAFESALAYSKQRKQFGRSISEFQAIQFKLADMAVEIDAARLLTQRAAWMKDSGQPTTMQSSSAKLFASEVAVRVANECMQIYGGYGYLKDYPAEKYYRDVKLCTIGEGTSEIQRVVIARELLKSL